MTAIVIGIMPQEKIRERVLAIVRGAYKPKPGEPKIWFTSMKSLAEVMSDDNRALLQAIREVNPESISALAEATGRKVGNLSRTLKNMSRYGIVEMRREKNHIRPIVKATEFRIVAAVGDMGASDIDPRPLLPAPAATERLGLVTLARGVPPRLDARRGARVAAHCPALQVRPHHGVAAVAGGAQ
jgi:predicted transcriptional regulator